MSKNTVYTGQSFLNKVVECTGDIDNAFEMALANGISITDNIDKGHLVKPTQVTDWDVFGFFQNIRPATNVAAVKISYELPGDFPYSF